MVGALSKDKTAAIGAVTLLTKCLNEPFMSPGRKNTVLTELREMQGVLHLSRLLCPELGDDDLETIVFGGVQSSVSWLPLLTVFAQQTSSLCHYHQTQQSCLDIVTACQSDT